MSYNTEECLTCIPESTSLQLYNGSAFIGSISVTLSLEHASPVQSNISISGAQQHEIAAVQEDQALSSTTQREDRRLGVVNEVYQSQTTIHAPGSTIQNVAGDQCNITNVTLHPDSMLTILEYVSEAVLSLDSPRCLVGTRTATIDHFVKWATNCDRLFPQFQWLYGPAGTGKSSIVGSIAARLKETNHLGASYVFRRGDNTRRNLTNIFSTIAIQLAEREFIRHSALMEILNNMKPHERATKSHSEQLQQFICNPCHAVSPSTSRTTVIIIDAIDECEPLQDQHKLLRALGSYSLPSDIRVLFTSRPELEQSVKQIGNLDRYNTSSIEKDSTAADIRQYVRIESAALSHALEQNEISDLVEGAGGLFQWIVMALRILKKTTKSRKMVLQKLLSYSIRGNLDDVYKEALNLAVQQEAEGDEAEVLVQIKSRLGRLLTVREPLPLTSLIQLREPGDDVDDDSEARGFKTLGSLLIGVESLNEPVRPLHASLRDYLVKREKSGEFFIDTSIYNQRLALATLQILNQELKFNIADLPTSYVKNQDQPQGTVIPKHVSYACRFWADHLKEANTDLSLEGELRSFLENKFLYWLEVLSLTGSMSVAHRSLAVVTQLEDKQLKLLAKDAQKFVAAFFVPISLSAPHIYLSALPFAPKSSIIAQLYRPIFPNTIQLIQGERQQWPSLQTKIQGQKHCNAVAFSPDGTYIVSGSEDNTIRIWDSLSGEQVGESLVDHDGEVFAVAFSPDGTRIVSGSEDKTIRIWDASSGEQVGDSLVGHDGYVTSVAFSLEGTRIVSGSFDNTIRIWDALSGEQVGDSLVGHNKSVRSVAFSPDGTCIVSGSDDNTVRIWDSSSGEQVGESLVGHYCEVFAVTFSPSGTLIVSGSADNTLRIWHAPSGGQFGDSLVGHGDWVVSVAFSPDGTRIVSGSLDNTIRIWDASSGQQVGESLVGHDRYVTSVAFSPDGTHIVSGSHDNTIRIWDALSVEQVGDSMGGHDSYVTSVAFSPEGTRIVSGSFDNTTRIWDSSSGEQIGESMVGHARYITSVAFSPEGSRIVSGSDDTTIRIWDVSSGEQFGDSLVGHDDKVFAVAFSPDGNRIVSVSLDKTLRIWDASSGEQVEESLVSHDNWVSTVAISPDGNWIVSSSQENTIQIWDASSGEQVGESLVGHDRYVTSVSFSTDGTRIVSGSNDKTIRIWDALSGEQVGDSLVGHDEYVTSVAFSPDGTRIVSGSDDKTIRIWDALSGEQVGDSDSFVGHDKFITSVVVFSPNGTRIVSGLDHKTAHIVGEIQAETATL